MTPERAAYKVHVIQDLKDKLVLAGRSPDDVVSTYRGVWLHECINEELIVIISYICTEKEWAGGR